MKIINGRSSRCRLAVPHYRVNYKSLYTFVFDRRQNRSPKGTQLRAEQRDCGGRTGTYNLRIGGAFQSDFNIYYGAAMVDVDG